MAIDSSGRSVGGRGGNRLKGLALRMKNLLAYMVVVASIAVQDTSRCHGQSKAVFSLLGVDAVLKEVLLEEGSFSWSRAGIYVTLSFHPTDRE
jgi:hypothetical protein